MKREKEREKEREREREREIGASTEKKQAERVMIKLKRDTQNGAST